MWIWPVGLVCLPQTTGTNTRLWKSLLPLRMTRTLQGTDTYFGNQCVGWHSSADNPFMNYSERAWALDRGGGWRWGGYKGGEGTTWQTGSGELEEVSLRGSNKWVHPSHQCYERHLSMPQARDTWLLPPISTSLPRRHSHFLSYWGQQSQNKQAPGIDFGREFHGPRPVGRTRTAWGSLPSLSL